MEQAMVAVGIGAGKTGAGKTGAGKTGAGKTGAVKTGAVKTAAGARGVAATELPCRTANPDLWFAEHPAQIDQAKTLCQQCPVRAACLAGAIERHELWGVWGGQLFVNGAMVATKRGRGRPRKSVAA